MTEQHKALLRKLLLRERSNIADVAYHYRYNEVDIPYAQRLDGEIHQIDGLLLELE